MGVEFIAILALVAVCILLVLDRYFDKEQHQKEIKALLEQLGSMNTALISKSSQDYVMMRAMDKTTKDEKREENPDEVDLAELNDSEFDKLIEKQNE